MAKRLLLIITLGSALTALCSPTDFDIVVVDNSVKKKSPELAAGSPAIKLSALDMQHYVAALDHSVPLVLINPVVHHEKHFFYPEGFTRAVRPKARAPTARNKPVITSRARDKPIPV